MDPADSLARIHSFSLDEHPGMAPGRVPGLPSQDAPHHAKHQVDPHLLQVQVRVRQETRDGIMRARCCVSAVFFVSDSGALGRIAERFDPLRSSWLLPGPGVPSDSGGCVSGDEGSVFPRCSSDTGPVDLPVDVGTSHFQIHFYS